LVGSDLRRIGRRSIGPIVAPFAELETGLAIAVEDDAGDLIAGAAGAIDLDAGSEATHDIIVSRRRAGRVVARGPGAGTALARATVASLAAAIAAVAEASSDADRLIGQELALGRRLQRSFVSLVAPDVPGFEIASHYEAAREIGGDFFDLFRRRTRRRPLSIVIADVTGKGIAAALMMAFVRPLLHAAIDHTRGPVEALERTNRILVGERRSALFITVLCIELDVRTGQLTMANGGHEPPLLVPAGGQAPRALEGSGTLLGAFDRVDAPECTAVLEPGDVLVCYTDGVTDAKAIDGQRFGDDRLLAAIESGRAGGAHGIAGAIRSAVDTFQSDMEPADDVTFVVVGRLP